MINVVIIFPVEPIIVYTGKPLCCIYYNTYGTVEEEGEEDQQPPPSKLKVGPM